MDLDTFESFGVTFQSATPAHNNHQTDPLHQISNCNLINFIAIVQSVGLVFVNVTWHRGLELAGQGATASVQQALGNASTNLALKKFLPGQYTSDIYKAILSEIVILQHPLIRAQRNIIDIYGVGWDVRSGDYEDDELVPVLVYENASLYGSLRSFIEGRDGPLSNYFKSRRSAPRSYATLLEICRDIGLAIETMHSCNIVHGDLKPENVLVFPREGALGVLPKIIDFGYSVYGFGDDDLVRLPCTEQWKAPEWHHRAFRIQDAKKTDIYSYAKICNWVFESWGPMGDFDSQERLKADMDRFYKLGLCQDPAQRTGNVSVLLAILDHALVAQHGHILCFGGRFDLTTSDSPLKTSLLNSERESETSDILGLMSKELPQIPNIMLDFPDFQGVHFVIRERIQAQLLQKSRDKTMPPELLNEIAFQLALCYELAFGVKRDACESQKWLMKSGRTALDMSAELRWLRQNYEHKSDPQGLLEDSRVEVLTDRYKTHESMGLVIETYEREREGLLHSLGPHAIGTIESQYRLALMYENYGFYDKCMVLLQHMLTVLEEVFPERSNFQNAVRLDISSVIATQGDPQQAILRIERLSWTKENPRDHVIALQNLSSYYGDICDYEQSAECARQAWSLLRDTLGERHPNTINALERLAYAMTDINLREAEEIETEVLNWRRMVLGEKSFFVLETMKNLAYVKANIAEKRAEAIEMQRDVLSKLAESPTSSWLDLVHANDRLAWIQEYLDEHEQAINTRNQLLTQKERLLLSPQGLAFLGNHVGNLSIVGRTQEAQVLGSMVLARIQLVLKPLPKIPIVVIRGVARAFLAKEGFDKEAREQYLKIFRLKQTLEDELGEFHERTALVSRFQTLLWDTGNVFVSARHILGLQHPVTKYTLVRLKNRIYHFVRDDTKVDTLVLEAIEWMKKQIALLESESEQGSEGKMEKIRIDSTEIMKVMRRGSI